MATIGRINPHARRLRREATDAERRLWYYLRNRLLGGFKFKQQETIGPFIADFACIECKLIVEADGSQHCDGRDAARTEYLESLDWQVLRFWNNDILQRSDAVLEVILTACIERQKANPYPALSRKRERGNDPDKRAAGGVISRASRTLKSP